MTWVDYLLIFWLAICLVGFFPHMLRRIRSWTASDGGLGR